jgi:hypothetical protein
MLPERQTAIGCAERPTALAVHSHHRNRAKAATRATPSRDRVVITHPGAARVRVHTSRRISARGRDSLAVVTVATRQRVTRAGGGPAIQNAVRKPPTTRPIGRTQPVSMPPVAPVAPAETTGEIVLTWGPEGPSVTAPDRAAVPALELFGMRRVPGDPRAVELPGGIRYLIGSAHRRWRGAVYLHRMPQ